MVKESEILKQIGHCLDGYRIGDVVLWWERLQSFKIRHFGYWIKGCTKGTSDIIALVRGKDYNLIALFIEVKTPKGRIRKEQAQFQTKYHNGQDIFVLTIRDVSELRNLINKIGINYLDLIP